MLLSLGPEAVDFLEQMQSSGEQEDSREAGLTGLFDMDQVLARAQTWKVGLGMLAGLEQGWGGWLEWLVLLGSHPHVCSDVEDMIW